ncbi:MAG TPA: hypothetical protein VLE22_10535, partial [Bryobacteraceae bacterium]|nr:hypothetical protein [Bryobacteraceae bacterium]
MKRVGSPVPSPDGKWVVFSVTEPSYDPTKQVSDLWIVPADGSAKPRRLTFTKGSESGVAWSPDSRRIAFSAKREGDDVAQVYVLDLGGGEAIRMTSLETGAESPRWSPDGKSILFNSLVYPADGVDRKARKYNALVYNDFPIRHWDRWLDERHAHPFVQAAEPGAKPRDLFSGTKVAFQAGFGAELGNTGEELDAIWTPDGASIVFAATLNRNAAAYDEVVFHLFRTKVDGGEPEKLTGGEGSYGKPAFSPDGKNLYAVFNPSTDKIYNLNRIARFVWPAMGKLAVITASFDRSADSFEVSPDGRTVYVLAEEHGHDKIFAVPA